MTKSLRSKGKISLTRFFQRFKEGDRVVLKTEPAYQKGGFHRRYHGKAGKVEGKQGRCYLVKIKDGGKHKTLIAHPIHLQRA